MKEIIFVFQSINYIIMIGENSRDNWNIIDISNPHWIWFHVANSSSSHVVLKIDENIKIPKQVIKRCACLCKSHSSSKALQNIVIHYTQIKNIKKTDIVGQVILLTEPKIVNIN